MKKLTKWTIGVIIGSLAFIGYVLLMIAFGIIAIGALALDGIGWRKIEVA